MRVGIIGSSQNESKTEETYAKAVQDVKKEIDSLNIPYSEIELVSGGSSWADHIAITLFSLLKSEGIKLTLYLPCEMTEYAFTTKTYFGRELNLRHRAFSEACFQRIDNGSEHSLNELYSIIKEYNPNVKVIVDKKGFKSRNTLIAKDVEFLIAVSNTEKVSGGTKDTWDKFDKGNTFKKLLHFD